MAVLAGCESADFVYLHQSTGLTKGTLSKHLNKLETEGYIGITKSFKGRYPNTAVSLTPSGRKAFRKYRRQYELFIRLVDSNES
jgi:DNA-binding MarR family transcriptional regulator